MRFVGTRGKTFEQTQKHTETKTYKDNMNDSNKMSRSQPLLASNRIESFNVSSQVFRSQTPSCYALRVYDIALAIDIPRPYGGFMK